MFVKMDFYFIGISVGIFILFFLSLNLLLSKTGNRKANKFLAVFLLTISYCIFGLGILINSRLYYYLPHLILTAVPSLCLLGPSIFLYVQELLDPLKNKGKKKLLHFIPFIFLVIYLMPFFIRSGTDKIEFIRNWVEIGKSTENFLKIYIMYILIYIHTITYILFTQRKIRAYNRAIKDNFSAIEKRTLNWLRFCLNFTFVSLLFIIIILVSLYLSSNFRLRYNLIPVFISIMGCGIACKAITQPVIEYGEKPKSRKKTLHTQNMEKYLEHLLNAMENEKLYRIPDLSLGELSSQLDISRNYLSYVINNNLDTNFYEFINKYRLNEVKSELKRKTSEAGNLQLIASSAGFNSKTTFNVMFKKNTGMTPSQYRKKVQTSGATQFNFSGQYSEIPISTP